MPLFQRKFSALLPLFQQEKRQKCRFSNFSHWLRRPQKSFSRMMPAKSSWRRRIFFISTTLYIRILLYLCNLITITEEYKHGKTNQRDPGVKG